MDSKTEPASEAKRIEREAKDYADNNYKKNHYPDNWENSYCGYIAGANEEHNRAQEEITRLKAELERERELRKGLINDLNDIWENYDHHPLVDEKLEVLFMKTKNFKNGTTAR